MTLKFTTHILNGTDGTHAAGVGIALRNLADGEILLTAETDGGGRLQGEIASDRIAPDLRIELVIRNGAYWQGRGVPRSGPQVVEEVAIRMQLPAAEGHYHAPVMLSPNSFSAWWSA